MGSEWDTAVQFHEMFTPCWKSLNKGSLISLVVDGIVFTDQLVLGNALPDGQPVRIYGDVDEKLKGCRRLTVLGAHAEVALPLVNLRLDDASMVLAHGLKPATDLFRTVEFCAGLGATSVGLAAAGFDLACSVEWRAPLASLHETVHPSVPVVVGDIGELDCLKKVASIVDSPFCLVSGISCQPYSIGGSQGGSLDDRSSTLPSTIRACYLFQCPLLLLECVPPVRTNRYARSLLAALAHELGYHLTEVTLRLEDTWTSRRFRWWLVATHPSLGKVSVPDWPHSAGLVVRDLMPKVPTWPAEVIDELRLQPHEIRQFTLDGSHMRKYLLQMDQKLPTCLHSWGSPADPCPCTCRLEPFSDALIQSKGIYAVVVPLPVTGNEPQYRHLHPVELAILNGLVPPEVWTSPQRPDLRLCLCGVGQLASPLQALWVGACVKQQLLDRFGLPADAMNPVGALQNFKQQLYDAAKLYLHGLSTIPPTLVDTEAHEVLLIYRDDTQVTVQVSAEATVSQLKQTDDALQGYEDVQWIDAHTSQVLVGSDVVCGRTIRVCSSPASDPGDSCEPDLQQLERELPLVPWVPESVPSSSSVPESGFVDVLDDHLAVKRLCTVDVRTPTDGLTGFLHLSGNQLASLVPPLAVSPDQCAALRHASVTSTARLHILHNQAAAMADDEINLHVMSCVQLTGRSDLKFLDPVLATSWLRGGTVEPVREWLTRSPDTQCVITVVLSEGHWTPIMWTCGLSEVRVSMWEHADAAIEHLCPLHGLIAQAWNRPMFALACTRRSFGKDHCGAAAVSFLRHILLNKHLPVCEEELHQVHESLRQNFGQVIGLLTEVPKPWCWGLGVPDVIGLVANLLQLHGVPHAQCNMRAKMIVQSLGKSEVQNAVTGVTPWKSLKHLANLNKPVIQLVLPDEQAQYVANRQATQSSNKKTGGTKRLPPARPAELDPAKLVIETGAFCVDQDDPLPQTAFATLGPLSVGVALATFHDAQPFLDAGQVISPGGLALLVLNPPLSCPPTFNGRL